MVEKILTPERIKELLDYNPETGIFQWKTKRGRSKLNEPAGSIDNNGYVKIWIDGKQYRAHRLAWILTNKENPELIDHINGIKSDNRILNLRKANKILNAQNVKTVRKDNQLNATGVYFCKIKKKFYSKINVNKKSIHLGFFDNVEEAKKSYIEAKRKYHNFCTI